MIGRWRANSFSGFLRKNSMTETSPTNLHSSESSPKSSDFRVILLGEGTTSLINRKFKKTFESNEERTLEDIVRTEYRVDNKLFIIEFIDTGSEIYDLHRSRWAKSGDAFILVYSIASSMSFEDIKKKRQDVMNIRGFRFVPMILVGTKCDLETRQVKKEDGQKLANEWGCSFIETSAKTGENVSDCFKKIVEEMIAFKQRNTTKHHKAGWLRKRDKDLIKNWKMRWFVLTDNSLRYYSKMQGEGLEDIESMKGVIPLAGAILLSETSEELQKLKKQLKKDYLIVIKLETGGREYFLEAEKEEDLQSWQTEIASIIESSNYKRVTQVLESPHSDVSPSFEKKNKRNSLIRMSGTFSKATLKKALLPRRSSRGSRIIEQNFREQLQEEISKAECVEKEMNQENDHKQLEPEKPTSNVDHTEEIFHLKDDLKPGHRRRPSLKIDITQLDEQKARKVAVKKFNQKPKQGIQLLVTAKLLEETPSDIAKFLLEEGRNHKLRKSKIGEYLGEP